MESNNLTYPELVSMAHDEIRKGLATILRAPSKRGWSRILGQQVPSKNDCTRDMNSNIQQISAIAKEMFPDNPSIIKEEEEVKPVELNS